MQERTVYSVQSSLSYDQFKFMPGNRDVNVNKVKAIEESISKNGWMRNPILINEDDYIVDGQHRYAALKNLGMPIEFIRQNGLGVKECHVMNVNQKNWSISDFVKSFATIGNKNYQNLMMLNEKYGIQYTTILSIARGDKVGGGKNFSAHIKNGNLWFPDGLVERTEPNLEYAIRFKDVARKIGGRVETLYVMVCWMAAHPEVDAERLYNKIVERSADIPPITEGLYTLRALTAVYNKNSQKKIYLEREFFE